LKSPSQKSVNSKPISSGSIPEFKQSPKIEDGEIEKKIEVNNPIIAITNIEVHNLSSESDFVDKKNITDTQPQPSANNEEEDQIFNKKEFVETQSKSSEIDKTDSETIEVPAIDELKMKDDGLEQPSDSINEEPFPEEKKEKNQTIPDDISCESNQVTEIQKNILPSEPDENNTESPLPNLSTHNHPSPFIDSIIDMVILKSQTTGETVSPLTNLNQNLNHPTNSNNPENNIFNTNTNSMNLNSDNNTSNDLVNSADKLKVKSKILSKKKREFITWQASTNQQTDENEQNTIDDSNKGLFDPVDDSKKVLKRPKDELKQRVKKLKSSNKPKYISEYISESQNINSIAGSQIQSYLYSNNENSNNNRANLISNPALSALNVNRPELEPTKKDKFQKEKIRLEKENYIKSQLWEEHCYTPHLTWLKREEDKSLTGIKNEKSVKDMKNNVAKQEPNVNNESQVSAAVKQNSRSSSAISTVSIRAESAKQMVVKKFLKRTKEKEDEVLKRFLHEGIDREDMDFLRRAYELMDTPTG